MTRISNRRAFDYEFNRMVALARRESTSFAVVILDIDHFKQINDQHGHMVGDRLLKDFAQILLQTFRASDFVARFGGEEFIAILPNCTIEEACLAADRVRRVINTSWIHVGELKLRVTASFGIKQIDDVESESEFLERADSALYAAKRSGRDCSFYHLNGECHRFDAEVGFQDSSAELRNQMSRDSTILEQIAEEFQYSAPSAKSTAAKTSKTVLV